MTTVDQNDHVGAAAYLMKRADATALIVTQAGTGQPTGIITEADISHLVADGKNPNDVRIYQLMTARPTVVSTTASIRDAAEVMTSGRFRHLPVMGDAGLVGIVDNHRRMPRAARSRRLPVIRRHRPAGAILAALDLDGPCGPLSWMRIAVRMWPAGVGSSWLREPAH